MNRGDTGAADGPAGADAAGEEAERYGPLLLTRLRKDDGRSLIVFARDDAER